mmetsp:Transcript_44242/g.110216  ORF Transcript_44242/g.110216 Transcript_44242/m.110216 type:complete len:216 (-) Transcript_44242:725-1372(-)
MTNSVSMPGLYEEVTRRYRPSVPLRFSRALPNRSIHTRNKASALIRSWRQDSTSRSTAKQAKNGSRPALRGWSGRQRAFANCKAANLGRPLRPSSMWRDRCGPGSRLTTGMAVETQGCRKRESVGQLKRWIYNSLRFDLGNAFETLEDLFIEEADSDLLDHETKLWILGAVDWALLLLAAMFAHYLLFEWCRKDLVFFGEAHDARSFLSASVSPS